jgi:hypothetical protein
MPKVGKCDTVIVEPKSYRAANMQAKFTAGDAPIIESIDSSYSHRDTCGEEN